jgi:hypothetical protein
MKRFDYQKYAASESYGHKQSFAFTKHVHVLYKAILVLSTVTVHARARCVVMLKSWEQQNDLLQHEAKNSRRADDSSLIGNNHGSSSVLWVPKVDHTYLRQTFLLKAYPEWCRGAEILR